MIWSRSVEGLLYFIVSGLLCLWEKSVIIVDKVIKFISEGVIS